MAGDQAGQEELGELESMEEALCDEERWRSLNSDDVQVAIVKMYVTLVIFAKLFLSFL